MVYTYALSHTSRDMLCIFTLPHAFTDTSYTHVQIYFVHLSVHLQKRKEMNGMGGWDYR